MKLAGLLMAAFGSACNFNSSLLCLENPLSYFLKFFPGHQVYFLLSITSGFFITGVYQVQAIQHTYYVKQWKYNKFQEK